MSDKGVKQRDIQPCCFCKKGVCNGGQIASTRVRVTRLAVNLKAVQRQTGLEMMIGPLAAHMGPDEDILVAMGPELTLFVCDQCAMDMMIFRLNEVESDREREARGARA